ncbi:hypothetical protein LWI28_007347 [Acer negundo]|uniref:Uncharacterized protein n=1 Tax=Acer negundo TaxID=4023 RepID=A0AAD5IY62_ACENE|nr:hypothetical protein LWI28_007347 [Acer negundo]
MKLESSRIPRRSNAKPGAALAAAAAASRSVPTPHAAAIKSRRAVSGALLKVLDGDDHEIVSVSSNEISVSGEKLEEDDDKIGDFQSAQVNISGDFSSLCSKDGDSKSELGVDNDEEEFLNTSNSLNTEQLLGSSSLIVEEDLNLNKIETNNFPSPESDKDGQVEEDLKMPALETQDFDKAMSSSKDDEVGKVVGDSASTISDDILELVEERIGQLESEMISRRAEKKSRPSLKPLELAEELEKKQASTGLHWEEGAAAQPMRLEGVQRGSTTLGYFDVDASNTITQTIRSQAFRRDNGSPQVLAVHLNFIAVGMSKGVIVLVPSKYSAHHHDSLDSKVCADSVTLLSLVIVSYAPH